MGQPQPQPKPPDLVTLAEFLAMSWPDDIRRELHDGQVVAMAPPAGAHGTLVMNLGFALKLALRGSSCRVVTEAGIIPPGREHTYYQADLVFTCEPHHRAEQDFSTALLIAEVLSPTTSRIDFQRKLPDYRELRSVREIVLIDSERMQAEVHRRGDGRWSIDRLHGRKAILRLDTVGLQLALAELYDGLELLPDEPAR